MNYKDLANLLYPDVTKTIYNEIDDKQIFSDILSLSLDDIIVPSKIQKNAYLMISTQFEISKKAIKQLLENNVNKKKIKLKI